MRRHRVTFSIVPLTRLVGLVSLDTRRRRQAAIVRVTTESGRACWKTEGGSAEVPACPASWTGWGPAWKGLLVAGGRGTQPSCGLSREAACRRWSCAPAARASLTLRCPGNLFSPCPVRSGTRSAQRGECPAPESHCQTRYVPGVPPGDDVNHTCRTSAEPRGVCAVGPAAPHRPEGPPLLLQPQTVVRRRRGIRRFPCLSAVTHGRAGVGGGRCLRALGPHL